MKSFLFPLANNLVSLRPIVTCLKHIIFLSFRLSPDRVMLSIICRKAHTLIHSRRTFRTETDIFLALLVVVISVNLRAGPRSYVVKTHINWIHSIITRRLSHFDRGVILLLDISSLNIRHGRATLKLMLIPRIRWILHILVLIMHHIWKRILLIRVLRKELLLLLHLFDK